MNDRELVDALCEIDHGLRDWEVEFIESIAELVIDQQQELSPAQKRKGEEILEERSCSR